VRLALLSLSHTVTASSVHELAALLVKLPRQTAAVELARLSKQHLQTVDNVCHLLADKQKYQLLAVVANDAHLTLLNNLTEELALVQPVGVTKLSNSMVLAALVHQAPLLE
jgi:hypothetical protein